MFSLTSMKRRWKSPHFDLRSRQAHSEEVYEEMPSLPLLDPGSRVFSHSASFPVSTQDRSQTGTNCGQSAERIFVAAPKHQLQFLGVVFSILVAQRNSTQSNNDMPPVRNTKGVTNKKAKS